MVEQIQRHILDPGFLSTTFKEIRSPHQERCLLRADTRSLAVLGIAGSGNGTNSSQTGAAGSRARKHHRGHSAETSRFQRVSPRWVRLYPNATWADAGKVTAQDEDDVLNASRQSNVSSMSSPGQTDDGRSAAREPSEQDVDTRGLPPQPSPTYDEAISSSYARSHQDAAAFQNPLLEYSSSPPATRWATDSRRRMWNPIWLQRTMLVGFAVAFVAMSLATGLLYHFSVVNQGLSSQREAAHYGWKYGPTARQCLLH
jgi:hypothetical protein